MSADRDTLDDWTYIAVMATKSIELEMDNLDTPQIRVEDRERLMAIAVRRYNIVKAWRPERGEIPQAPAPWQPPRRRGWVGVDLDRTAAHYDRWLGVEHVGAPVPAMAERIRQVLAAGQYEIRIMTARVSPTSHPPDSVRDAVIHIKRWCVEHFGEEFSVTCEKDADMVELWDDRAVGVEPNTGQLLSPSRVLGESAPLRLEAQVASGQLKLPGTEPARPSRKRAARSTSRKTVARK